MDASTTQQKIASLYIAFFERAPEQSGFNFWEGFAQSSGMVGLELMKHIAEGFAMHPSFDETYGGLGNAAFVDAIYVNVGGSLPDAAGRAFWLDQLNNGLSRADFVAEYCYYVMELDEAELGGMGLTPAELADALARRATLYNQIEVSLAYVDAMGAGSNFAPGTDPMDPASLALDPAYQAAVNILRGVDADPASNDDELAYLSGTPTVSEINQIFGPTPPPPGTGNNYILTTGQDILTGTSNNDTFFATGETLQLGDSMDGAGGSDTLSISIQGRGVNLTGFAALSMETIVVKSLSRESSTIDLSDTTGVTLLVSEETDGDSLTFRDIQSVNKTAIKIVDTDEDHTFVYDLNAYDPDELDVVDLTVQEMRDDRGGPDITFLNRDWSRSNIDRVNLHSLKRPDAGDSPATDNYIDELNVGRNFDMLTIDGDADLEIEDTLDERLRMIDAGMLDADLTLDVASETSVGKFIYIGAKGDDNLDVMRDGNNDIALNTGDDDLTVVGDGNNTIGAGPGEDRVYIEGDGRHEINLGSGDDELKIVGDVDDYDTVAENDGTTEIMAEGGDDDILVLGNGRYDVALGDGDDSFYVGQHPGPSVEAYTGSYTVDGGTGNDEVVIWSTSGTVNATLGAGEDFLLTVSVGNQTVDGAEGNDVIGLLGNGNHRVTAGADNDQVYIGDDALLTPHVFVVHGVHNVDLGAGNDYLLINGGRKDPSVTDEDFSGGDVMTTIVGGGGNDTVDVREDHYLNANLGEGDDRIILRARDLTTDDMIAGGPGRDTMQLTNQSYEEELVGQSETGSTTGFEVFDLRNANITLRLTPDNFDTAENKSITVYTQEADRATLPANLVALGLAQGMTVAQFTQVAQAFGPTAVSGDDAAARSNLAKYLLNNGVDGVNFADTNSDGDSVLYTSAGAVPASILIFTPSGSGRIDAIDQMNFRLEPDGYMAVDITAVPLSLASGRTFTLDGGNIRDVVIADDDSINGRSTLRFDGPTSANQSVEDTLYVVGPADIEAADLRNVSGLENIILSPDGSQPGVWEIVLTAPVVNQTTGSAPLSIIVDPDVPAGSTLRVTLDPTVMDGSNNDVFIYRNSNVQVYIDGVLVTEPDYGVTDYDTGTYVVKVLTQHFFTTNTDRLIGTAGVDDMFIARSLDDVQSGDAAWGYDPLDGPDAPDDDQVTFRFAVANITTSLQDQLENAAFISIEKFKFDTENNVRMLSIGAPWFAPDLAELETGDGDDILAFMREGLTYRLNGGDDWISLEDDDGSTTVYGGSGEDSVYGGDSNDTVYVDNVEYISLDGGEDEVELLNPNPVEVTIRGAESIYGSSGDDWVDADNDGGDIYVDMRGGDDTLTVGSSTPNNATVYGGTGDDDLTVYASNSALVYGDDNGPGADGDDDIFVAAANVTVYGEGGADEITVRAPLSGLNPANTSVLADGGSGNDTMDVVMGSSSGPISGTVRGGTGDDEIAFTGIIQAYAGVEQYTVEGGSGNDTVSVTTAVGSVSGSVGPDRLVVDLGTGDDVATVTMGPAGFTNNNGTADPVTVLGGSGDDSITMITNGTASGSTQYFQLYDIEGGSGNDTVNIAPNSPAGFAWMGSIEGGLGDDEINLNADPRGGHDTLIFGDIDYTQLQNPTNTQGVDTITNFQFESPQPGDPAPVREDIMNFAAFLGTAAIDVDNLVTVAGTYAGGTVDANDEAGNSIVVLSSPGLTLTAANFSTAVAGTIQINDNGRAVVVVGQDQTGPGSGIQNFDVYFVQDIDTGAGSQTWAVNLVATVEGVTQVGIEAVMNNLLDGLTLATDDGPDVLPGFIGNQTYDMTGDDLEVFFNATEWAWNSGSDVLSNFDHGINDDAVNFENWYVSLVGLEQGGGGFSGTITPFTTADNSNVNLAGFMALFDAGAGNLGFVDTPLEIAQLFGAGVPGLANSGDEFSMGSGGSGVLLTGADGSPTVYMWDIDDRNGNGTVDIPEVTLIGTFQLEAGTIDPDITGFHASNFNL